MFQWKYQIFSNFLQLLVRLLGAQGDYYHHTTTAEAIVDYFENDEPLFYRKYCQDDFTDRAISIAKVSCKHIYT